MLFEHYPGIPRIIREEEDIDPEGVACGREIEDGSQLFTWDVSVRKICQYASNVRGHKVWRVEEEGNPHASASLSRVGQVRLTFCWTS